MKPKKTRENLELILDSPLVLKSLKRQAVTVVSLFEEYAHEAHLHGYHVYFYCGYRSPQDQAYLYRAGRSMRQIRRKVKELRDRGAPRMADMLATATPNPDPKIRTMAGPGQSNHNYGWAADASIMVGGRLIWDARDPAYQIYGRAVRAAGLEWAGDWKRFKEYVHMQLPGKDWRNLIKRLK